MEAQMTAIGTWIRESRRAAGLSHDRLGEMVGTSRQHLIKLEKGMHKPRPDLVARIAEATGKPAPDLDDEEAGRALPLDEALLLQAMAAALTHAANRTMAAA